MYELDRQYAILNHTMQVLRWSNSEDTDNRQEEIEVVGGTGCQRDSIQKTISHLSMYIPESFTFIKSNVNQILSLTSDTGNYHGLSKSAHPNTIFLYNTEKLISTPHILAAGIIHESIHQRLFSVEKDIGSFLSDDLLNNKRTVTSPWTGNQIHLNSFVHATYVWFGLYFYWMKYISLKRSSFDESLALTQARKLRSGYLGETYNETMNILKSNNQHRALHSTIRLRNLMEIEHEKNSNYQPK